MKNLTTHVPNYTQIYFPYSTVMSVCQGSRLACTWTVSIFRTLTYMQYKQKLLNHLSITHDHRLRKHCILSDPLTPSHGRLIGVKLG